MKSYLFFAFLFFAILMLYKFYTIVFSKFEYLMKYIMFGIGVLTITFPVIMNNKDIISDKIRIFVQKKCGNIL